MKLNLAEAGSNYSLVVDAEDKVHLGVIVGFPGAVTHRTNASGEWVDVPVAFSAAAPKTPSTKRGLSTWST